MLELDLDPKLPAWMREALLREARRSGLALADIERMSYDAEVVRDFLAALRGGYTSAFMLALDRDRLDRVMARAKRPAAASLEAPTPRSAWRRVF